MSQALFSRRQVSKRAVGLTASHIGDRVIRIDGQRPIHQFDGGLTAAAQVCDDSGQCQRRRHPGVMQQNLPEQALSVIQVAKIQQSIRFFKHTIHAM